MPTSKIRKITKIVETVMALDPNSIMEIGPGFGKYGVLFREYLDIWTPLSDELFAFDRRIDCCEGFAPYITPLHKYIYNSIDTKDVRVATITDYDLVVLVDILEHLPLGDAGELLNRLVQANKYVLISVPYIVKPQGTIYSNSMETHRSQFDHTWFKRFGHVRYFADASLILLISSGKIPKLTTTSEQFKSLAVAIGDFAPNLFLTIRKILSWGSSKTHTIHT